PCAPQAPRPRAACSRRLHCPVPVQPVVPASLAHHILTSLLASILAEKATSLTKRSVLTLSRACGAANRPLPPLLIRHALGYHVPEAPGTQTRTLSSMPCTKRLAKLSAMGHAARPLCAARASQQPPLLGSPSPLSLLPSPSLLKR
ncbi:hypothetical protein SVAN01_10547, partial [Stagonosporopsis vannaccii]